MDSEERRDSTEANNSLIMEVESGDEDMLLMQYESTAEGGEVSEEIFTEVRRPMLGKCQPPPRPDYVRMRSKSDGGDSCSSEASSRRGSRRLSKAEMCEEIRKMADGKQLTHFQALSLLRKLLLTHEYLLVDCSDPEKELEVVEEVDGDDEKDGDQSLDLPAEEEDGEDDGGLQLMREEA